MRDINDLLKYHTDPNSSVYAFDKFKKMSPLLNENNYLSYILLLQNHNVKEDEKKIYEEILKNLLIKDSKTFKDEFIK